MLRTSFRKLVAALVVIGLVAWSAAQGTLIVAQGTDAVTLDPHDVTDSPSAITAHERHCSRPQPSFAPISPRSLRSTVSSGVAGSAAILSTRPLTSSSSSTTGRPPGP